VEEAISFPSFKGNEWPFGKELFSGSDSGPISCTDSWVHTIWWLEMIKSKDVEANVI
jgi:hypothetical protein